jgi:glycosyltransferase involved in cell wall biosynthesis
MSVARTAHPRISIVTPSFNQAAYLETTLKSVLDQDYPNLEYIVVDGGSTDGSVAIIQKYAGRLAHWVSEPDGGHMDAINKGFGRSTGEIMGWINSDDTLCPWALKTVARIFQDLPQVRWLTTRTQLRWNAAGEAVAAPRAPGFARTWFYRGWHLGNQPGFIGYIQQESTFWRRELWEAAGGRVDTGLNMAGDFELWARFFEHADVATTEVPLAGFRQHGNQKTNHIEQYYAEAEQVLSRYRPAAIGSRRIAWRKSTTT